MRIVKKAAPAARHGASGTVCRTMIHVPCGRLGVVEGRPPPMGKTHMLHIAAVTRLARCCDLLAPKHTTLAKTHMISCSLAVIFDFYR